MVRECPWSSSKGEEGFVLKPPWRGKVGTGCYLRIFLVLRLLGHSFIKTVDEVEVVTYKANKSFDSE
jgi:hypothetical protein